MTRCSTALLATLLLVSCSSKAPAGARTGQDAASAPETPAPAAQPTPAPGKDFAAEAQLLYRVIACGSDAALPATIDAKAVEEYCKWLAPKVDNYRKAYVDGAEKFLGKLEPPGLPTTVVYPFGGGDLLSAITTYPNATEYTTLSLEHAGDPRRIDAMDSATLERSLALFRKSSVGLLTLNDSTSENLMQLEKADIPGQISFFLVGLKIHGFEPVSLRYFTLEPDGAIHYLTAEEIATAESKIAKKLNQVWVSPNFSEAFSNVELVFRPAGQPDAATRVHRHIAANLSDEFLKKDDRVLKHLLAKGKVSAMTKAASYLLWNQAFVRIRNYLLDNMVFMVSDSTGIPPRYATKAGFVQETYGQFTGPFLDASKQHSDDFVKLWSEQPQRALPFRYGYPEASKHWHMLITRRPDAKAAAETAAATPPEPAASPRP